jgi:hypothetical protein
MDYLSITAETNEDFLIALSSPALASIVDFSMGSIRVQMRRTRESQNPVAEWTTQKGNVWWSAPKDSSPLGGPGQLTGVLSIWSRVQDIYNLNLSGLYYIGARLELLGYYYDIFEGDVTFQTGIVRP